MACKEEPAVIQKELGAEPRGEALRGFSPARREEEEVRKSELGSLQCPAIEGKNRPIEGFEWHSGAPKLNFCLKDNRRTGMPRLGNVEPSNSTFTGWKVARLGLCLEGRRQTGQSRFSVRSQREQKNLLATDSVQVLQQLNHRYKLMFLTYFK